MHRSFRLATLGVRMTRALSSVRQQNSQVAQIVTRRPSHDCISQGFEERIGVKGLEVVCRTETFGLGASERGAIYYCTGGRTVSIDSVRARTQHRHGFTCDLLDAG